MINPSFDTFNAKKLSAREVAMSFVVPSVFAGIAGADHCYVIGPRGSGKTTLLRMLHGESLMAWRGREAEELRAGITYSSVFLPADELWASQTTPETSRAAFTAQMLYAFVESMIYRTSIHDSSNNEIHLPVVLDHGQEVELIQQCAEAWGFKGINPSFYGIQGALDLYLSRLPDMNVDEIGVFGRLDSLALLSTGVRAFNRAARQPNHRWALLLDEMELAPPAIHQAVISHVRGGSSELILKVSMSPFDRYMHSYGAGGGPIPGHDFQTVYLSGQSRREIHQFTAGLWRESLRSRGLAQAHMSQALPIFKSTHPPEPREQSEDELISVLRSARAHDSDFAQWLRTRRIDINALEELSYNQRSATIRKVFPLLVFRNALLNYRDGRPVRRSRKKSLEPFTGASAIVTMLEGNPRWIKTAFAQMLNFYDPRDQRVSPGFQYDAIMGLANSFESLLRVLPRREPEVRSVPVTDLVDAIATYLNRQNTSSFSPDPPNCFTVDGDTPPDVINALVMGLYAGAFVHVRDRRSPAVLSDFRGQRFRLAYLLAIRDDREFPLRLGRDVRLSTVLHTLGIGPALRKPSSALVELDWGWDETN